MADFPPDHSRHRRTTSNDDSPLLKLPQTILIELMCYIASSSLKDYYHFKNSCRILRIAGNSTEFYKNVPLENYDHLGWTRSEQQIHFLLTCFHNGNPFSLFIRGLKYYTRTADTGEKGLSQIREAAVLNNCDASYSFAILVLAKWSKFNDTPEGNEAIHRLQAIIDSGQISSIKERVTRHLQSMNWGLNRNIFDRPKHRFCENQPCQAGCRNCIYDTEVSWLYHIMNEPEGPNVEPQAIEGIDAWEEEEINEGVDNDEDVNPDA